MPSSGHQELTTEIIMTKTTDLSQIRSDEYVNDALPDEFIDPSLSYKQFLEARGGQGVDPLSPEGLALQAEYVKALEDNCHPLDVLRKIALNPFSAAKDRIAASKAIMEYTMVKTPNKVEVTGISGAPLKIDSAQLSALSNEELDQLMQLLEKANSLKLPAGK